MSTRDLKPLKARKSPRQPRSKQMRGDLLQGATRVLERSGAKGFTTNRVAEVTGVSVGSVYQYYPNKAALLADLHTEEAERVWSTSNQLLTDTTMSARRRFESVVLRALEAQAAAAEHHTALDSTGVRPRKLPEMIELEGRARDAFARFLREEVPERAELATVHAALCVEMLFALLERMATDPPEDFRDTATHTARMLADYVGIR